MLPDNGRDCCCSQLQSATCSNLGNEEPSPKEEQQERAITPAQKSVLPALHCTEQQLGRQEARVAPWNHQGWDQLLKSPLFASL